MRHVVQDEPVPGLVYEQAMSARFLPEISLAFSEGRLSYTKARALTRVAAEHGEDALLRYALDAPAPNVEERCRQKRNVHPDSVHDARRAWEARALSAWRNAARGTLCLKVELPLDVGELVMLLLQGVETPLEPGTYTVGANLEGLGSTEATASIAAGCTAKSWGRKPGPACRLAPRTGSWACGTRSASSSTTCRR